MLRRPSTVILLCLFFSMTAHSSRAQTPSTTQSAVFIQPAGEPAVKIARAGAPPDKRFLQMHESFLKRGKEGKIGVLFLGDSITEGWVKAPEVWNEHYGKLDPANFGIGGDRTQHVLWRIDNGELDGISPRVVVLMIGTNNVGSGSNPTGNTPDEIAAADKKIVDEIHQKLPDTKVLLLGVFPRGADPESPPVAAFRNKIKQINEQLAKLDDGSKTRYLDIGDKFLNGDGIIRYSMMPDALHPTAKGYKIWADEMDPLLTEMMK